MKGNAAIIKCLIPSFVTDFVHVVAWILDTTEITSDAQFSGGKICDNSNPNIPSGTNLSIIVLL